MLPPPAPLAVVRPELHRALITSKLPLWAEPDHVDPQWRRVDTLLDRTAWRALGGAYRDYLQTPHLAPGLVCALQHYAGRALQPVVAAWCADGTVLDLRHDLWWARIDQHGRTTAVSAPDLPVDRLTADATALTTALRAHLDPLVAAVAGAANATERLALGCVAASVAGSFAVAYRGSTAHRRAAIERAAHTVLGGFWVPTRADGEPLPTVSMVVLSDQDELTHDRHTCCLIRLGKDHGVCSSCPQLDVVQRRRRQADRPRSAPPAIDLRGLQR